jgi:competence protein ComEC
MDEIKRKLELIDRQLARRRLHERAVSTCPLVFVAVGLLAGVFAQSRLDVPVSIWTALLMLSAAAAALLFAVEQFSGAKLQYVNAHLALVCFVCLGAIRLTDYGRPAANDIRISIGDERKLATIRGMVVTEPHVNRHLDWKFARFRPTDPSTGFYLRIEQVETADGWAQVRGMVRVQVDGPAADLQAGHRIQAYCWLEKFAPPTNPGQFDSAGYLARRNIFIGASVKSRSAIKVLENRPAGIFAALRARARQAADRALLGDMDAQDTNRGLLQALLLGDRREIDSDTYIAFRKTGLLHFVSLSGMHMGILFGMVWWASKTAGLMKPARAMICAIAIGVFLLVVPPRAPTVRAAIICWTFCASLLVRRHHNPINTLSLAVIILLLIRPTQLFEAGWQLSFASVLGLLLFCERLHFFLHEKITGLRRPRKNATVISYRMTPRPGPYLLRLFSAGLTAWTGGAGILLYHFHTINPLTSVWTVLAFPFVSAILVMGFLKMILFFLLPTLSGLLGFAVVALSSVLIWVVQLIARLDVSQVLIGRVSIVPILAYYCAIVFAGYARFRRPLVKRLICAAVFAPLIAHVGALKYQRNHPDNLVVTCLDVGHGQAILTQLPGGTNILFDAGSMYRSNIGARIVVPFLSYRGIDKIDAIIISHNDVDHINGIPEIAQSCNVAGVYANDAFFGKTDEWGTIAFLKECLSERGLKIEELDDRIYSGDASIKTLWPDENVPYTDDLTDNNRSLVSLIEFAGVRILLCSDIEEFAQAELLRKRPNLEADVVIVPHHGSTRTLDATFLEGLNAKVLICSCDRNQYERSITGMSQTYKTSNEVERFYTAKDGAISITIWKDGSITTEPFAQ